MVAPEIIEYLKSRGFSVAIKRVSEKTLDDKVVWFNLLHAVNTSNGITITIRVYDEGLSRIHVSVRGKKNRLEKIADKASIYGFKTGISGDYLTLSKSVGKEILVSETRGLIEAIL